MRRRSGFLDGFGDESTNVLGTTTTNALTTNDLTTNALARNMTSKNASGSTKTPKMSSTSPKATTTKTTTMTTTNRTTITTSKARAVSELTSTTPPTGSSGTTLPKAVSNAASDDVRPNQIEQKILAKLSTKRFRKFNHNWNNKEGGDGGDAAEEPEEQKHTIEKKHESSLCCCCTTGQEHTTGKEPRDRQKLEISGDVDIPSQDGIPDFHLRFAPSHSLRQVFAREYKIFWSKLTKRFGAGGVGGGGGPGGGGRGDELIKPDGTYNVVNGTIPTDQDLIQARHLYETIPVVKESEIRIAKKDGERLILGKGNNGAVLIAFYSGSRREIPEGVALKIFFRSSIVSVRKEALLSALAAQTGSAPKVYGIVYMKRIDAHALICEFIPKNKNSHGLIDAWTLRSLIKDEKDAPTYSAAELFRLSLRMAEGLQQIHDQHVVVSDIKTDNVLLQLNEKGSIIPFYIDYGLSGFCKGKELNVKSHVGGKIRLKMESENFMDKFPHYPPECARGECTSMAGDVFGLGRLYMRMFRGIKAIKRHPLSKQYFQAFHACMRDNPKERLRLGVLREKLTEIVTVVENETKHHNTHHHPRASLPGAHHTRPEPSQQQPKHHNNGDVGKATTTAQATTANGTTANDKIIGGTLKR